jgi:outer membrane protein TolC
MLCAALCAAPRLSAEALGLWDCVKLAVGSHPVAEAGRWAVRGAEQKLSGDNTLRRPSFSTTAHYTARTYVPEIPIPTGPIRLGDHHDAGVGVEASYLLYDWDRRDFLLETDRRELETAARLLDTRREALAYQAGAGFILLQAARRNVEIAASAIATAEAHLKDVQSMLDHGLATPDVVLKARVRVEQARVEEDRGRNSLEVARAQLLQRMGLPLSDPVEFGEAVESIPDADELPLTEVFVRRPELESFEMRMAALETRAALLARGGKPNLMVFAGADYARPGADQFRNEWITYGRAGISFQWEFFDWGRSGYEARRVDASRMELTFERNVKRAEVALEVKTARLDTDHARGRVALAGNARQAAEEHLRVVGNLFDQGQVTSSEFLDAQEEVTVSSLELSRAGYEYDLARWRLALATGELQQEIERRWPERRADEKSEIKTGMNQAAGGSDDGRN